MSLINNNIIKWMFLRETVLGTSLLTAADTDNARLFGLMDQKPGQKSIQTQMSSFSSYAARTPKLQYGKKTFPPISLQFEPTQPYGEYLFLGKPTAGSPNKVEVNTVGSGYNPALSARCEESGGDGTYVTTKLQQYNGCQCIEFAERIQDSDEGWGEKQELGFAYMSTGDKSGSSYTNQYVMMDSSHQPDYLGDTTGLTTTYSEPPVVMHDTGGANTNVSSYFNRIEFAQSRAWKGIPVYHDTTHKTTQGIKLGGYGSVKMRLWGILPNDTMFKDVIDNAANAWSIQLKKSSDVTKYKTYVFPVVRYAGEEKTYQDGDYYLGYVEMEAESFYTNFTLETGMTFATWFT